MKTPLVHYAIALLVAASAIILIALQEETLGWTLLAVSAAFLGLLRDRRFAKDMFLVVVSLGILGLTPINTDTSIRHMLRMGATLILAVLVPYLASRFVYRDHAVRFPLHEARAWHRSRVLYIIFAAVIAYFLLPFYLKNTGAYHGWPSATDSGSLIRLFIGTNSLGIWDELFFVITVLGLMRRYFPFYAANIFQSTLFTAFLYELGFRGWGYIMIFAFALLQGYVFKKTESLIYVVTIHLTTDLVLFLALIYSYHPAMVPLFIT